MDRTYRKGAIGALMDEYERATSELTRIVNGMNDEQFELVHDRQTRDDHCRSIQTIMSHVVHSGYGYAHYIRAAFSVASEKPQFAVLSRTECLTRLAHMITYTADTLDGRWEYTDEQIMAVHIQSRWGQHYDLEQLLEHAIVHILRHRRQIDKFLSQKMST